MMTKKMTRFFNLIWATDSLPIIGGASGAVIANEIISPIPPLYTIFSTIILAAIGSVVGYLVKLFLDYIINKRKRNKIETR